MRFHSKDKDPRLDNRDARANGRKIKTALLNLNIVLTRSWLSSVQTSTRRHRYTQ